MAGISMQITLMDRVSNNLGRIKSKLNNTTKVCENLENKTPFESVRESAQKLNNKLKEFGLKDPFKIAQRGALKLKENIEKAENQAKKLGMSSHLNNFNSQIKKTFNLFSSFKTSNPFFNAMASFGALQFSMRGISGAVSKGIKYASDLVEVQNVVDVSFGKNAKSIDAWATTTLKSFGLNELSAKKFSSTMGAMLKSSGIAGDGVVSMAMRMAELAGDMASFYNLDPEEAFNKIRSGISGETEPLKSLGIDMSMAALQAYALAQGINTKVSAMDRASLTTLRYKYLLDKTTDSHGDASRTIGSFARQQQLVSENWSRLIGAIVSNLLPALTGVMLVINNIMQTLADNMVILETAGVFIGTLALAWAGLNFVIALCAGKVFLLNSAIWANTAALLANPITTILVIISAVVAAIYYWIRSVGGLSNAWAIVSAFMIVTWLRIKKALFDLDTSVLDVLGNLKITLFGTVNSIKGYVGDLKVAVLKTLSDMLNGAIDSINSFISVLNKIPGVNIEAVAKLDFATKASAENEAAKQKRASDLESLKSEREALKQSRLATSKGMQEELDEKLLKLDEAVEKGKKAGQKKEQSKAFSGALSSDYNPDIAANTADTAGNTKSVANHLEKTKEDLKYLRDIAEQDIINRFTTAEVKIDYSGMTNTISNDMDIDGVINSLTEKFAQALYTTAEGVHA